MNRNHTAYGLIFCIICSLFFRAEVSAQAVSKNDLLKITAAADTFRNQHPIEKLYLQLDKPYYAVGDTIWFKAYLLNDYLIPSDKSRIINIDIANDSNKVIKQYRVTAERGLSGGNISLNEKEGFTAGTYTIRAYTNWMRNFGNDYFFYKSIYVSGSNENNLLVNTLFNTSDVNNAYVLSAKLLFSDINKIPFSVAPLRLDVMNGNKRLYRQKLQTGVDGSLDINFNIPEKPAALTIIAENERKDKKAIIPVDIKRPENADVQFLPEGGNLIAGLPAHIGFKAIGENGKAIDISGIITDHNQNKVAEFKSLYSGIGSFDLAVESGKVYTAKVTLPGGLIKEYPLPNVKNAGLVLRIKNPMESDSVSVSVAATNDVVRAQNSYYLIGKARGIVCYAAIFDFHESNAINRKIAKSLFPTGIAHFTIMTANRQPLNEWLVFIDHHDNLDIQFKTDKQNYSSKDSINLQITVKDNNGNPVKGNFSLAVTDDAQVKTDSLNNENFITKMLLTSDLKGYIEQPGYYLNSKTTEAWQALDNLLLTQGWVGYDWGHVFNPPAFAFRPERELAVNGSVLNVFNKPVKGTNVLLFSKLPAILMDTITDENGKFVFDGFPRVDTPIFVLKAVNKSGKSFNVRINVDDIKPPDFIKPAGPVLMPWYVNSDSTLLNYAKNHSLLMRQENFPMGGHILKEVKIKAKKIVHGSQNLNGPGEADIILDEKDMEAAGKKTLLQLLQENVKGFTEGVFTTGGRKGVNDAFLSAYVTDLFPSMSWYFIGGKPMKLIVDGISVSKAISHPTPAVNASFFDMRDYLKSHSAEDVKGIEIIHTAGYAAAYLSRFDPGDVIIQAMYNFPPIDISASDFAFVEITTRGGHGPIIDNTPGMYLYKPLPLSLPKQFYSPRYTVTTKDTIKDYRSTIFWAPNVLTDKEGKATVTFYAADKKGIYTVIVEGTDGNGAIGSGRSKVNIKDRQIYLRSE